MTTSSREPYFDPLDFLMSSTCLYISNVRFSVYKGVFINGSNLAEGKGSIHDDFMFSKAVTRNSVHKRMLCKGNVRMSNAGLHFR